MGSKGLDDIKEQLEAELDGIMGTPQYDELDAEYAEGYAAGIQLALNLISDKLES